MDMLLDVNVKIYPMRVGDKFALALGGRKSLADKFEYIMHGNLYKLSDEGSGKTLKA
ncbi:hypothetical protein Patl1_26629 [Pistacia atlantica]|uniref:Uncharacterized protein n=1 Tax=Pistacia atlantica TaxID=434234 RepID=A0ACC1AYH6_9ROSI|nr:hypothetical protein Patl1_26629 [Pistacia atlantica]